MIRRGKVIAIGSATAAGVVLVTSGILARDWIREEWYIRKLYGDGNDRHEAARRLVELHSLRAIPHLVELFRREAGGPLPIQHCTFALTEMGQPAVPYLVKELKEGSYYARRDAAMVLGMMGLEAQEAIPALEEAAEAAGAGQRQRARAAIAKILAAHPGR